MDICAGCDNDMDLKFKTVSKCLIFQCTCTVQLFSHMNTIELWVHTPYDCIWHLKSYNNCTCIFMNNDAFLANRGGSGVMIKLLACRARGLGFELRSRH